MSAPRTATILLTLAALASCAPAPLSPEEVITEFNRAVQAGDTTSLYCLSGGAVGEEALGASAEQRQEGFERWFSAESLLYEEQRERGAVELTGHGVRLARLFALGRGTYYSVIESEPRGEGRLRLRTRLDFGYASIDLSRLSPGTTFYIAGAPAGRVAPIKVPARSEEISVEALESIVVEWELEQQAAQDGCDAGWRINAVLPLETSAKTTSIRWIF